MHRIPGEKDAVGNLWMKAVLFFFCPVSVPFAVIVPADKCWPLGWDLPHTAFCPGSRTLGHSPGVSVSGENHLSYKVQTQGLRPWSHQLYTTLKHHINLNWWSTKEEVLYWSWHHLFDWTSYRWLCVLSRKPQELNLICQDWNIAAKADHPVLLFLCVPESKVIFKMWVMQFLASFI